LDEIETGKIFPKIRENPGIFPEFLTGKAFPGEKKRDLHTMQ
jgi:hypothetical protein